MIRGLIFMLVFGLIESQANGKWRFFPGIKLSNPQWLALSLPVTYGNKGSNYSFMANMDPGIGGLKTAVGFARDAGIGQWSALAIQLSTIKAWGYPIGMESGDFYAGVDARLIVLYLHAGLGLYRPISSDSKGPYLSATVGFGF